jgi:hypothetical protein
MNWKLRPALERVAATSAFCRHTDHVFFIGAIALKSEECGLGITIEDTNPLTVVSGGLEALDINKSSSGLNASAKEVKESLLSVMLDV